MLKLSSVDNQRLRGVHPDLVKVIRYSAWLWPATAQQWTILQGVRTLEEQKKNVAAGASQTMNSRHVPSNNKSNNACAIDIAFLGPAGKLDWTYSLYIDLSRIVKTAADIQNVPLEWGGDWDTLKDAGHFQLPWSKYP